MDSCSDIHLLIRAWLLLSPPQSMLAGLGAIFSLLVVAEAKFVNNELDHLMDFPLERDDVATECDLYLARETWR
jgi:hypothetical protein